MECLHCGAWNEEDERRCVRCGRRLRPSSPRPAPDTYPVMGATAPALDLIKGAQAGAASRIQIPPPAPHQLAVETGAQRLESIQNPAATTPAQEQQLLFRDAMPKPKVVPIPTLAPVRSQTPRRPARPSVKTANAGRRTSQQPSKTASPQRALDFQMAEQSGTLGLQVEAVIFCDAPVAIPAHRIVAAAYDGAMVSIAIGMFLGVFFLSGGHIALTKQTGLLAAAVVFAVSTFYKLLWCLGNGDTPGMRFAGLRLVNFDGRRPGRKERGVRLGTHLLSILSAGLGLIWSLVDEESLTWHDHISKTFPTPE